MPEKPKHRKAYEMTMEDIRAQAAYMAIINRGRPPGKRYRMEMRTDGYLQIYLEGTDPRQGCVETVNTITKWAIDTGEITKK